MRVNAVNYEVTNKQTNVASRTKTGMKQQPSFGMKMNNEHAIQKDKVSFGGPWDIFKKYIDRMALHNAVLTPVCIPSEASLHYINEINSEEEKEKEKKLSKYEKIVRRVSKSLGYEIGYNLSILEECIKADKGEIISPKEQEARIVVNTYAAASATVGDTLALVPFASLANLSLAPKQRKLMVEDIADIYELKPEDRYIMTRTLGLEDTEQINNFITDSTIEASRGLSEYIKKKAVEESFTSALGELSQTVVQVAPFIKAGLNTRSAKKIGEAVIDACKYLSRNY